MSQILHIFRKDARHHWPEILISLALLVVYATLQPRTWTEQQYDRGFLDTFVHYLPGILILSWVFLIVRIVQGETLVGNRQFWITRPYEWHRLLAAKLLSAFVFFHLPLFIMQIVLLYVAKFPVMPSIPGLLYVHALFVFALVLPSLTIGSVTSGIGQTALALLIVCVVLVGFAYLSTVLPDSDVGIDSPDNAYALLYGATCVAVILIQFNYRRTVAARLIIGAVAAAMIATSIVWPFLFSAADMFPPPKPNAPLPAQFSLDQNLTFGGSDGEQFRFYRGDVELEFPIQITGLAAKTLAQLRAAKLDLDLPNGEHWTSHWQSVYHNISFGRTRDWPDIKMKRSIFERFKSSAVRARLTLGFNVYELGTIQTVMAEDRINYPGGGRCLNEISRDSLRCFSALKQPGPLFIAADLPNSSCAVSKSASAEGWSSAPASFVELSGDSTPDLQLSPINDFNVSLARQFAYEDRSSSLPICAGTPLYISNVKFRYPVRGEVDLGQIVLNHYAPGISRKIIPRQNKHEITPPSGTLSENLLSPDFVFLQKNRPLGLLPSGRFDSGLP
jgi:hypothetical protein